MLWPARTTPLLPLQVSLLLRQELPKVRLEDAPQRLRTYGANLLCACHTQFLQPYEPYQRILRIVIDVGASTFFSFQLRSTGLRPSHIEDQK
jgi:hypothetical protein